MSDRARAKSLIETHNNNLPHLVRDTPDGWRVYAVESRSNRPCQHCGAFRDDEAGQVWLVTVEPDGSLRCDCPALACWHQIHVERALAGEIGIHGRPRRPMRVPSALRNGSPYGG